MYYMPLFLCFAVVLLNVQGKIEESLREEAFEKSLEIIAHTLRQCCMDGLKKISLGCNENHVVCTLS